MLIFDALEGVYDTVTQAVASVTDKPIVAAVYPHYHAEHISDTDRYVEAVRRRGIAPTRTSISCFTDGGRGRTFALSP